MGEPKKTSESKKTNDPNIKKKKPKSKPVTKPEANGNQANGQKVTPPQTPEPVASQEKEPLKTPEVQPGSKSKQTKDSSSEKSKLNEKSKSKTEKKDKSEKRSKTKKAKKGFIRRSFSLRNIFLIYIVYVFFACNEKYPKNRTPFNERVCNNGISQYILQHDLFRKYIEPAVNTVKVNYISPSVKVLQEKYDTHGKPIVASLATQYEINAKPYVDSTKPHVETAKVYYAHYIEKPSLSAWKQTQELYNEHAREHVDKINAQSNKYYEKSAIFVAPYVKEANKHISNWYAKGLEYNRKKIQPFYLRHVLPVATNVRDNTVSFYHQRATPAIKQGLDAIDNAYKQHIVPAYKLHLEPHVIVLTQFIREQLGWAEAERKAKEEARLKKQREEQRLKEKARIDAEKRKAKEAELAAIEAASAAFLESASLKIETFKADITDSVEKFRKNVDETKNSNEDNLANKLDNIKNFAADAMKKFQHFTKELEKDSSKNITDKTTEAASSAKGVMDSLKDKSKEARNDVGASAKSVLGQLETLRKEIESTLETKVAGTKKDFKDSSEKHSKADKTKLGSLDRSIDEASAEAYFAVAMIQTLSIDEVNRIVNETILSIKEVAINTAQEVVSVKNEATNLFQEEHARIAETAEKDTQAEPEKPLVPKSRDPVLEKLKLGRRDPILAKLKAGYQKALDERKHQQAASASAAQKAKEANQDEGEEYTGEENEECDADGECG